MQTRQATIILTYDQDLRDPADLADILATCEVSAEGVVRATVICGDVVITREAEAAESLPVH